MSMIQNKILTVIGHKGYGKTVLTEKLMIEIDKPTIICDPRLQYEPNDRRIHFKNVASFRVWIVKNYQTFKKYKLELVVNVLIEDFEELASLVYKMKKICFVVDEVDMFFDPRSDKKNGLNKLVQYGRHNQIDIITTSRRPANISRNLTALTDVFYFAKIREPNDKKYIKDSIGIQYVSTVEKLQRFSFLRVEDENIKIIKTTMKDLKILA